MRVIVLALCLTFVTAGRLRASHVIEAGNGTSKVVSKPAAKKVAQTNGTHLAAAPVATKDVTKAPSKIMTDEEQISNLQSGLKMLVSLKAAFTAQGIKTKAPNTDLEKFAQGAISNELASKESPVWASIERMLAVTDETAANMTGKSKSEKDEYMNSLAKTLNYNSLTLDKVTQKARTVQKQRSEEYLLGVLMQHQKDWSMEEQLNTTRKFAELGNCDAAKKLLNSYNKSMPLAPQFAALMDQKNATAQFMTSEKAPKAAKVVTEHAAAKMFLQLVSSFDRVRHTAERLTKAPTPGKASRHKVAVAVFLQVVRSFDHGRA
jgi:hypothetical protein